MTSRDELAHIIGILVIVLCIAPACRRAEPSKEGEVQFRAERRGGAVDLVKQGDSAGTLTIQLDPDLLDAESKGWLSVTPAEAALTAAAENKTDQFPNWIGAINGIVCGLSNAIDVLDAKVSSSRREPGNLLSTEGIVEIVASFLPSDRADSDPFTSLGAALEAVVKKNKVHGGHLVAKASDEEVSPEMVSRTIVVGSQRWLRHDCVTGYGSGDYYGPARITLCLTATPQGVLAIMIGAVGAPVFGRSDDAILRLLSQLRVSK